MKTPPKLIANALALAGMLFAGASLAHAQTFVTVNNFNFSTPTITSGGYESNTLPTGWSSSNDPTDHNAQIGVETLSNGGIPSEPSGTQVGNINGTGAAGGGDIYQDVGALLPNVTYTLSVYLAGGTYYSGGNGGVAQATLALYNGTNDNNGGLAESATALNFTNASLVTSSPHNLSQYTLTYTTGSSVSGDLTIGILNTSAVSPDQIDIADVTLSYEGGGQTVPEPSTYALLLGGLVALGYTVRRRRLNV